MRWFAALLLALLALSACSSGNENRAETVDAGSDSADQDSADAEAAEAQDGDTGGDLAGNGAEDSERQVITTAYAAVEVDDAPEAVTELLGRTTGYGGYVEDRSERTDAEGDTARASLTLRLPAENLSEMLESLDELGEVSELSESAEDVTGTVRDLDARIEALETSVDRLIEIMAEADTAEDLLQVETSLSQRQADLEALQAERNALGDQVAMSTLHVELSTEPIAEVQADGFLGGLQSGWDAVVTTANALLVVAGTLLPWLAVLAVPVVVIVILIRRRSKRRPAHQRPPAAQPDQPVEPSGAEEPAAPSDGDAGERS